LSARFHLYLCGSKAVEWLINMKILYGLSDGALIPRDKENLCRCLFAAECNGELKSSLGQIVVCDKNNIGEQQYLLTGIPAGGPYSVTLTDDTDKLLLQIWVGDLWLMAGQSNMEGAGRSTKEDLAYKKSPNKSVRAYYLDNRWDACMPLNHEPWISVDDCQREVWKASQLASRWQSDTTEMESWGTPERGVGPALFFGLRMYEITGVPQGVIPCALGGTSLAQWQPGQPLYDAMIRRFVRTGSLVRGVFWYQGESETSTAGIAAFDDKMRALVEGIRRDTGIADLPFVQTQLATTHLPGVNDSADGGKGWEGVREKQRLLDTKIPHLATVSAIDCKLDDLIHLSSDGQKKVGRRGADAMAQLCGFGGAGAPKLLGFKVIADPYRPFLAALEIYYEGAGAVLCDTQIAGFSITEDTELSLVNPATGIATYAAEPDKVTLFTEVEPQTLLQKYVRYGYSSWYGGYVTTETGHALPAFGPLKISDYLL